MHPPSPRRPTVSANYLAYITSQLLLPRPLHPHCIPALQMKLMPLPRPVLTGNWQLSRGGGEGWGAAGWGRLPRGARSPVAIRLKYLHVAYLVRIIRSLIVTDSLRMRPVAVHVLLLFVLLLLLLFVIVNTRFSYCLFHLFISQTSPTVRTAPITPTAHRRPLATEPRNPTATAAL